MPTYQYACTACDERLEAVQTFTDAPLTECPACGGSLRKVFSAVGVVFKGSGFYKTDSRAAGKSGSSERKDSAEAASSTTPGEAGGSGGKSESKSDSKSDGAPAATPAKAPSTSPAPAGKTA